MTLRQLRACWALKVWAGELRAAWLLQPMLRHTHPSLTPSGKKNNFRVHTLSFSSRMSSWLSDAGFSMAMSAITCGTRVEWSGQYTPTVNRCNAPVATSRLFLGKQTTPSSTSRLPEGTC